MQLVQAPRASAILYNLLKSQASNHPWLLPANICPIVPVTFFKAGVPIEFVDISAETLHMDLEQAEELLERGPYVGVLYAHTYGEPSTPIDFFQRVKSRYPDLLSVDDRCLCVPDLDASPDMVADVALYSTGYAKIVDMGFGGYAFFKDCVDYQPEHLHFVPDAHDEIEKDYKQSIQDRSHYKYRESDWLQTDADLPAWFDYRLKIEAGMKTSLQHRTALNRIYSSHLPDEIQLPREFQAWRFNVRLENKQRVLEAIFASGLFASSHYASLAGIMAPGQGTQAEVLANGIINLFNDHHFDEKKVKQVCDLISEILI
jgi:hypothetical protein